MASQLAFPTSNDYAVELGALRGGEQFAASAHDHWVTLPGSAGVQRAACDVARPRLRTQLLLPPPLWERWRP